MDETIPIAEAIAVRGEVIEMVGSDNEVFELTDGTATLVDLEGRVLMPGFVDAHTHLLNDHRQQRMSLDEAQFQALRNGITTLGTLYVDSSFLREIEAFNEAGFLRVRTGLYLVATDPCGEQQGDWWKDHPPTRNHGEMLRINGVKIFTDGGACGNVALSFELEPGWELGDLWFSDEELVRIVGEVDAAGHQAAIHAIGDRAVVQSLDVLEQVLGGHPNDLRHRMEHVSVIPPEDVGRFGELGVVPVLMGEFPNCTPYGPPVPEQFGHMEWPWRSLRETNPDLPLAWHTDVPFQSINPFDHMLGFVTRIDIFGRAVCPPADWLKANTLFIEDALSIMTIQSAYALWRDDEVGSLSPGKYADLIVLMNNPLEAEPAQLHQNAVLLTVVGGRIEYCDARTPQLCPGFTNRRPVPLPDLRPPLAVQWLVAVLLAVLPLAAMLTRRKWPFFIQPVGGLAGIIGGTIWIVILIMDLWLDDVPGLFLVLPFSMALGVAGLAALWQKGKLGTIALWVSVSGAIIFAEASVVAAWFRNEAGWPMFLIGIMGHTIGLFLFGLANLRGRILPLGNALPLLVGLFGGPIPFILSFLLPDSSDLPFGLLLGVLGAGWVLIGLAIIWANYEVKRTEPRQPTQKASFSKDT